MHLTNYSVNKQSGKFERHSDFDRGSKRSIKSFLDRLKSSGYDTATLWYNITVSYIVEFGAGVVLVYCSVVMRN